MEAPGLLELDLGVAVGLDDIERARLRGEEPERAVVRAPHLMRLDHRVGGPRAKTQRPSGMPERPRLLPVDHRPLMQTEAGQLGRSIPGGPQQGQHRLERLAPGDEERVDVDLDPARHRPVEAPAGARHTGCFGQPDARTGMPAAQLPGPQRVVGPEEVLDRMRAAGAASPQVGLRRRIDARLVGMRSGLPVGESEHAGHEGRLRPGQLDRAAPGPTTLWRRS